MTHSTKQTNYKHLKLKKDKFIRNESDKNISLEKSKSLDKSRSTQGTETEDTVKALNKSRYISSASLSDKITKIENPKEIDIRKDNPSLSGMSGHGASVSSVTPDKQRTTRKNKRNNTSDTSIKGKYIIQVPDNPSKIQKEDIIPDVEKKNNPTI